MQKKLAIYELRLKSLFLCNTQNIKSSYMYLCNNQIMCFF